MSVITHQLQIGTVGAGNANGATVSGNTLNLQLGTSTQPGLIGIAAQTVTGAKTFNDGIVFGNGGTNVNFYQEATQSATFTFNGTGSPGSATVTLRIVRIGSMVSVLIPDGTTATTGTSSNTFSATAALPTWARPTVDFIGFSVPVQQNAIVGTTMGILRVRTSGNMDLFRDTVATVWSNANANSGFISSSTTVGINGTYLNYHIF